MKNSFSKLSCACLVFGVSFLGLTTIKKVSKAGNQAVITSSVALGAQAQAYCNEATYQGETNNGHCSGAFNDITSRCQTNTSGTCDCANTQPGG